MFAKLRPFCPGGDELKTVHAFYIKIAIKSGDVTELTGLYVQDIRKNARRASNHASWSWKAGRQIPW